MNVLSALFVSGFRSGANPAVLARDSKFSWLNIKLAVSKYQGRIELLLCIQLPGFFE